MQPEPNGSTAVAAIESSNTRPLQLDDILIRAFWKNRSFLTTHGQIERIVGRSNVADLANPLSNKVLVEKRIKPDGTVAPIRDGGDLLVVLDGMAARAAMAGMAATGPNLQQDILVQLLAALMAPNRGNRNRNRLGTLLGRASSGDDDPAPFGKRVLQFLGGVANDFLEDFALEMDKHVRAAPVDPAIGISDAVCSPVMVMECINAILVSAARHGSAVLLHRRNDGENTFESFCRGAVPVSADLEPSQLLRVVSSPSLDLLLRVMVRADLATLHDNGKIVAIGEPVDDKVLAPFIFDDVIPRTERRIAELEGKCEAFAAQARKALKEGKKEEALRRMRLRQRIQREIEEKRGALENAINQAGSLDAMKHDMEIIRAYRVGLSAMQAQNRETPVESVDKLVDDLNEENELADELNAKLQNMPGVLLDADEEAACLAELEEFENEHADEVTNALSSVSIDGSERMTDGDGKANGAVEQVDAAVEEKPATDKEAQDDGKQKKMVAA